MAKLVLPLSDIQLRSAKPKNKSYKLADGGGLYLEVMPNGRHVRVIQIDGQTRAALADIPQSAEKWAARHKALLVKLLVDPGKETIEDRLGLFLPTFAFGLTRQAVVANLLLNLV